MVAKNEKFDRYDYNIFLTRFVIISLTHNKHLVE